MDIVLNILSVILEMLIYYFFFRLFFGKPKYQAVKMIGIYLLLGAISLGLSVSVDGGYTRIAGYFVVIISLGLCYNGNIFIKLFLPVLFQTFSIMVERCWAVLLKRPDWLLGQYGEQGEALYYLTGIILSNITILLLVWLGYACKTIFVKNPYYDDMPIPIYYTVLFLFPVCMIYVIDQYYVLLMITGLTTGKATLPIIVLTALIVLFFFVFDFLIRYQYEHRRLNVLENQIALEQQYHDILLNKHQQFQALRHDMKGHLNNIASLIKSSHVEEALVYAQNQVGKLAAVAVVQTGHPLLDTILTIKEEQAQQLEIDFHCYYSAIVPELNIEIDDLASLLDNALNNALEASQCIKEPRARKIWCRLVQEKNYLHIIVRNRVAEDIPIAHNIVATTKENKKIHGFGLPNIKRIVDKYQGSYNLQCADKIFTVRIVLPI